MTEPVEGAKLVELLSVVSTAEVFAAVIEGYSQEVVEDAIASQDTQPKRLELSQWYAAMEVAAAEAVEPSPVQIKVGDRLRLAKDLLKTTRGKLVQVLEWFGDWGETSWEPVTIEEIQSGTWELIT